MLLQIQNWHMYVINPAVLFALEISQESKCYLHVQLIGKLDFWKNAIHRI